MAVPMATDQANAVFDVLVQHAGARDGWMREDFLHHQTAGSTDEYRFQGGLGFGGKFWNCNGRWYVSCYPEDATEARRAALEATNAALADVREREMPAA